LLAMKELEAFEALRGRLDGMLEDVAEQPVTIGKQTIEVLPSLADLGYRFIKAHMNAEGILAP
jgi:hypothetical protein